ncbi:glycoside hydrolase family 9 protein [Pseudoduganella namucuonensis]|uniref:N-terminal ig-like domain of cellulase n=1 Tax=Pseudoduganella namucuonensis TaxID=1035707 RepID=A0A1I7LUG5_9BURK|nr:glycoside hydrolase family 9 protein [Pseudoduganella namucuonensis]SFV13289.1 N-terminal ig-like domain of cellulase [Pseudoduganella namucuonensis]
MDLKKSVLLIMAALGAPAWAQTCQPSATTPYFNLNGTTAWVVKSSATVNTGTTVALGPQPFSGSWSWAGCGTSGSSREQTIKLTNTGTTATTCTATATFTNSCGAQTTQQYNFTIWPAMAANAGKFIVVDQFGYPTDSKKVAVLRRPMVGYDANGETFWPQQLRVVNSATGATVKEPWWPTDWNGGATDPVSGDKVWWYDFSDLKTPGTYEIVDSGGQRSARFEIGDNVYRNVLIQAVKMFYYQRAGQAKSASQVGFPWADGASHLGAGQDPQARRFLDKNNASTARDLRGGWFDAGDYNKYTPWAAGYTQDLMDIYRENPTVFTDDFGIAESYNGIPDILDEAKWGLDWLKRMQNSNGSVLSIEGIGGATPPSSDTAPSYYGDASTNATLAAAGAFASGAKALGALNNPALNTYAADLLVRAKNAWNWALANPNVLFYNNSAAHGTEGLGAGQQEGSDGDREEGRLNAAIKLYAATGETIYRDYVDANYTKSNLMQNWNLSGFSAGPARTLLYYTSLPGATQTVASAIRARYLDLMERTEWYDGWARIDQQADPYRAFIGGYKWSSNAVKAHMGTLYTSEGYYGISHHTPDQVSNAALDYVHYLHGVNPFGKVYLSNMKSFGAENSVNQIWHGWFNNGSPWDDAQNSLYGPAPGYLVGGPAGGDYSWAEGCLANNDCPGATRPVPPLDQPPMKTYKDFNDGWPYNTWSISEPSNGYQLAYIRLLARFVK